MADIKLIRECDGSGYNEHPTSSSTRSFRTSRKCATKRLPAGDYGCDSGWHMGREMVGPNSVFTLQKFIFKINFEVKAAKILIYRKNAFLCQAQNSA